MARLRLSRLSAAETGAARRVSFGGSTLTVLAEPGDVAIRNSRRDLSPEENATGELDIITGSPGSGDPLRQSGTETA